MRKLIKSVFLVSILFSSFSISGQELKINNVFLSEGEFSYSRGDSIFIAGENDTVRIDSAMILDLKAPKILLSKTTIVNDFINGSFKAFYDSYSKVKVVPEITLGDTLSSIILNVSGGIPPYTYDWLTFDASDSIIFDTISDIFQGLDFSSLSGFFDSKYKDPFLTDLSPGVYTCRISDVSTINYFDFVIGNTWEELNLLNCFKDSSFNIVTNVVGNGWDSHFSYNSYFPLKSDWQYSALLSDTSNYSIGISDTTEMQDSLDVEYGALIDEGVIVPIVGGELSSRVITYKHEDIISMMFKNNAFIIKLNGNIVFKRYVVDSTEKNFTFNGNLKSGSIILPQLYLPIIVYPLPIAITPRLNLQHLICGVENSGRICTTFPSYVNWSAGYLNNGECMYNLSADNYTITYQTPFNTSITAELGYMSSWITDGLEVLGISGLQNNNITTVGFATSVQKIQDANTSQWVELNFDCNNSLMLFTLTNDNNSSYIGFVIYVNSDTGNALPFILNSGNAFPCSMFSPNNSEIFKIRTQGTGNDWNVYRCYYQNGNYIEQDITGGFNFSAPNLNNAFLFSILFPGNSSVLQAATSFGCEVQPSYYELRKDIEGQNYPVSLSDGVIRFVFEESYLDNDAGNQLSLFRYSGNDVGTPCLVNSFNSMYGYNEYEVSISACGFSVGDIGLLELETEKNEKWYLRFKIVE